MSPNKLSAVHERVLGGAIGDGAFVGFYTT